MLRVSRLRRCRAARNMNACNGRIGIFVNAQSPRRTSVAQGLDDRRLTGSLRPREMEGYTGRFCSCKPPNRLRLAALAMRIGWQRATQRSILT